MEITLNAVDNVLLECISQNPEYIEFCESLSLLQIMTSTVEYMSEAIDGANSKNGVGRQVEKIASNTVQTTKDVATLWGITTDAGGAGIKSIWDLAFKLISIAAKALAWIAKKLIMIPNMISSAIDMVTKIPKEVKSRIRGDIRLNITVEDVQSIIDTMCLLHMKNFLMYATQLSKGEMWSTLFHKENSSIAESILNKLFKDESNDIKTIARMKKEYKYFNNLRINPTVVNMNDQNTVECYFGQGTINFTDIHGHPYKETYYMSLKRILNWISEDQNNLNELYIELGTKLQKSQQNATFGKLNSVQQKQVLNVLQMMSDVVKIIGNIMKAVISDMDTIKKTTSQIINRQSKISDGTAKKKLFGRKDTAIKDLDINKDPKSDADYDKIMKQNGYVKINRYVTDKTGKVTKEFKGEVDQVNKRAVWVKVDEMPKGAKRI